MIAGFQRTAHARWSCSQLHYISLAIVLLGAITAQPSPILNDEEITWWHINKFLTEFITTGLAADKLQAKVDGYRWFSTPVKGLQKLNEISRKVSQIFQRSIEGVQALKKVIEEEYSTWPEFRKDEVNNNSLCCENEREVLKNGCSLVVYPEQANVTSKALHLPDSVLWEFKKTSNIFSQSIIQYFAFTDGSLYMYPAQYKNKLLACEEYDPRLRYFFTMSKSPEAREVVMVLDVEPEPGMGFGREVVQRILKALSPIDRMAVCLPCSDFCWRANEPEWPRQDPPLGISSLLGLIAESSEANKNLTDKQLKHWFRHRLQCTHRVQNGSSDSFSSHIAALSAGNSLFESTTSGRSSHVPVEEYRRVLVYVTDRSGWNQLKYFNDTLRVKQVVIHPIKDAALEVKDGEVMQVGGVDAKVVPFYNKTVLSSSPPSIASFGLNNPKKLVIPMPYWDAFGRGYIMSICLPLTHSEEFVGTACIDISIVNLLESETNVDEIEDAYVFIVNGLGKTLMHPLFPAAHSLTQDPPSVTIDRLEQAEEVKHLLHDIITQNSGVKDVEGMQVRPIGRPRGSGVPSPVEISRHSFRYQWNPINNTDLTIALVLPLHEGKVNWSTYTCGPPGDSACQTPHFQYHKAPSTDQRNFCSYFGTEVVNNTGLVKFAPSCFVDVLSYIEDENDDQISKIYDIFNNTIPFDQLLRSDLQKSVRLLEDAEEFWKGLERGTLDYIGVRYMGTADGAFISFPGTALRQAYDHRTRPWYMRAVSGTERASIAFTTPYCDELGVGMVHTITKTLYNPIGNPVAVVAADVKLQYVVYVFQRELAHCQRYTCILIDRLGYVVLMSDWATFNESRESCTNSTLISVHLNRLAPDIAREMIANNVMRRKGCHDYERDLTFYYWSVGLTSGTKIRGESYVAFKIPQTNLYLIVRKKSQMIGNCNCNPDQRGERVMCHDTCATECECPCIAGPSTKPCSDPNMDVHKYPLPACKPRGLTTIRASNNTQDHLDPCHSED